MAVVDLGGGDLDIDAVYGAFRCRRFEICYIKRRVVQVERCAIVIDVGDKKEL